MNPVDYLKRYERFNAPHPAEIRGNYKTLMKLKEMASETEKTWQWVSHDGFCMCTPMCGDEEYPDGRIDIFDQYNEPMEWFIV